MSAALGLAMSAAASGLAMSAAPGLATIAAAGRPESTGEAPPARPPAPAPPALRVPGAGRRRVPVRAWFAAGSLLALLLHLAAIDAAAQEAPGIERTPEGVVLDFQQADLRSVVTLLAQVAGLNVVFSNLPDQTVTLRTSRAVSPDEVRQYLESVARAHGLELTEENGLVRIAGGGAGPEQRAVAAPAAPAPGATQDQVRVFVHQLRHAKAETLARTISALFGGVGAPLSGDWQPERSLTQELRADRVRPILPDQPAVGAPVPPQAEPAPGTGLAAGLEGPVTIIPDLVTNSLLIRATAGDYATIQAAIQALDTRPLQVLIEVLIAEVRRSSQHGLGISVNIPEQTAGDGTRLEGSLAGAAAGDLTLSAMGVGTVRAEVLLRALASDADVTILSRPIILAQNNQPARILVGSQRPFIQLFRALPTDAAVRDQVVQYRDVGTQLTIRPTINADGYVNLVVLQEVSNATAETQFGAPVISTREAQTELLVRDGHTVVIGGLVDRQRDAASSGIPLLKEIPLIGGLFRSSLRRHDLTELFLFITPHVIATDEELDEATRGLHGATDQLRRRLEAPLPLLRPDTGAADPVRPDTLPDAGAVPPGRGGR